MTITGMSSDFGNVYEGRYASSKKEVTGGAQDRKIEKKARRKPKPQNHYEKRKYLRKLFEEKQARKEQVRAQLEEMQEEKEMYANLREKNAWLRERDTNRAMERYEASVLKW